MLIALDTLSLENELPATEIPDEKQWTENYCYIGYDFESRVGLYLHIGRWLQNPMLWREEVYVYLPDGTTLNYRSIGAGDCSRGPQGALSLYECVAPGAEWRVSYNGPTNHLDRATMVAGVPLPERTMRNMTMDVSFRRAGPVIMYDIPDNNTIGRWHYEQEMLVDAVIRYDGREYRMASGQGWRDHTRGPRYLGKVRGHVNVQGKLADGRFFSAYRLWVDQDGMDTMVVDEARIVYDGQYKAAKIIEASRHLSTDDLGLPFHLVLDDDGERIELTGTPLNLMIYSCTPEYEVLYGYAPTAAPFSVCNQPTQWRHGDHLVGGNIESSLWAETGMTGDSGPFTAVDRT